MRTSIHRLIYFFTLIFSLQLSVANAPEEMIIINNFKTGDLDYVIVGEKAVLNGDHVHLDGVQARLKEPKGDIYLFTQKCEFDQEKRVGYGDKPVHIRNESMTIDGEGFELDIDKNLVTVRKDVKVRIYGYRDDLLGK